MTDLIPIMHGQWVLAFFQPFGPHGRTIEQHLERFVSRGGGWDHIPATEIFSIHEVQHVMPKTYVGTGKHRHRHEFSERFDRANVIAAGKSEAAMIALRDKLYAIGEATDDAIEVETRRRMAAYRARQYAKAQKTIHRMFPHFFRRAAA